MQDMEKSWPSDQFDAIFISTLDGDVEIEGTDGPNVELEGEWESRNVRPADFEPRGRWLVLDLMFPNGADKVHLSLPRSKAWVVDVSSLRGDVEVSGVTARLSVSLAKGNVQVRDARGLFQINSAKGDVQLERCAQAEVPERPARPDRVAAPQAANADSSSGAEAGEEEPFRRGPRHHGRHGFGEPGADAPFPRGPRLHREWRGFGQHIAADVNWDLSNWFRDWDWEGHEKVAEGLEEAAHVLEGLFGGARGSDLAWTVRLAKGNVEVQDSTASGLSIYSFKGDVQLERSAFGSLDVELMKGNFEAHDTAVNGNWRVDTKNGDLELVLPRQTQARVDLATRHGEIESNLPLVRVNRPGPGSRFGGRMVGTFGPAEGTIHDVRLTTLHGNIEVHARGGGASQPAETSIPRPAAPSAPVPPVPPAPPAAPVIPTPPTMDATAQEPVAPPAPPTAAGRQEARLAVLSSLSRGEISIEEAGKLLDSLA